MIEIADPYIFASGKSDAIFRMMRAKCPVAYHPNHRFGPFWSLTRFSDVLEAEQRADDFSSSRGITIVDWESSFELEMLIATDGSYHRELRATAAPAMSGQALKRLQARIRSDLNRCLDALPIGAPLDWVSNVAAPIARRVAQNLFSLTAVEVMDLEHLTSLAHGTGDYFEASVRDRIRRLRTQKIMADIMSEDSKPGECQHSLWSLARKLGKTPLGVLGNVIFLSSATLDTMKAAISASVMAQHMFPDEARVIYQCPAEVGKFITEVLRWHAPLAYMRRTTTRPVSIGGVEIPANAKVLLWYASANRDEDVFQASSRITLNRKGAERILSFGAGPHHCLGRKLAEWTLSELWSGIIARQYRFDVSGAALRMSSYFVNGFDYIPVVLTRLS